MAIRFRSNIYIILRQLQQTRQITVTEIEMRNTKLSELLTLSIILSPMEKLVANLILSFSFS